MSLPSTCLGANLSEEELEPAKRALDEEDETDSLHFRCAVGAPPH